MSVSVLLLGVASCGRHPAPPPPAPAVVQLMPVPGVSVALIWDAAVDLDLYLTDPTSETVYFANTPSRSGAHLVQDVRCADVGTTRGPFVERAQMPEPLPGRYRVGVDFIDVCNARSDTAGFRAVVELAGKHHEVTGAIRLAQFQPIVLE